MTTRWLLWQLRAETYLCLNAYFRVKFMYVDLKTWFLRINGGGGRKGEVDERIMRNHEQYTYKTLFCIIINIHMGDATGCIIKIWSISYICWLLLNLFFFICMYIIMKDGLTYSETQWTAVYICYIYLAIFANGFSLPGKKKFKVTPFRMLTTQDHS